jgi:two-component system, cell cycle sensor histidine kinase and response regulator CckA
MESARAAAARIRALVIDDDSVVRGFVERVLRDAGYETAAAPDGAAARELVLRSGPPHIVVTDESMPRMSGHEFSRWVRQRHPGVKVLYLTGYADPVFRDHRDLWEDEGYLDKPCTIRGLLQAMSLLLFRRLENVVAAPPTAEV